MKGNWSTRFAHSPFLSSFFNVRSFFYIVAMKSLPYTCAPLSGGNRVLNVIFYVFASSSKKLFIAVFTFGWIGNACENKLDSSSFLVLNFFFVSSILWQIFRRFLYIKCILYFFLRFILFAIWVSVLAKFHGPPNT